MTIGWTLDGAWQQFIDNTQASLKVTMAGAGPTGPKHILGGQLALCEAANCHAGLTEFPSAYYNLVAAVRVAVRSDHWGDLAGTVGHIDALVGRMLRMQHGNRIGVTQVDAWSALVWLGRSVLLLAAGDTDRANECSNNTLDAIARVVIVTGHLRSDLMRLMQEIGVVRRYDVTQRG